jgi:hypothetical protein
MIFKTIAILKNYGTRTQCYLSYVNSLLIISTFISVKGLKVSIWYVIPILVLIVVLVGYLDYKFIYAKEMEHINSRNDLKKDLKEIKDLIKKV